MSAIQFPEFRPETRSWMFWLARIFGKRVTGGNRSVDGTMSVTLYHWRGKLWAVERKWVAVDVHGKRKSRSGEDGAK